MKLSTIEQWLAFISHVHHQEMELGLDRVRSVAARLGVLETLCPTIVVGGTNGKGTTVAALESIYRAAKFRVASFTSPFLFRFNEEIKINGVDATDDALCKAFMIINEARGNVTLTPFEFHTLAALYLMQQQSLDVRILEIGLGGRLDAVNIVQPDVSVITSIDIDHAEFLGNTREAIGFEKAGIFRQGLAAVCGDANPPNSLVLAAEKLDAPFYQQGKQFYFEDKQTTWVWECMQPKTRIDDLPSTPFALSNLSTALMTVTLLQHKLPVSEAQIKTGIREITLRARQEVIPGDVPLIFDVAHNPAAVHLLVAFLEKQQTAGKTLAVFSMLADKDISTCLQLIKHKIDHWYVAPLTVKRAASLQQLEKAFADVDQPISWFDSIKQALEAAKVEARTGDSIIIFGSFYTVSACY